MMSSKAPSMRWVSVWSLIIMLSALLQTVVGGHVERASTKTVAQKKDVDTTTPRILVPLYLYPLPNAWDPLFTAIKNNPAAAFTVIINPDSGPGSSKTPDSDYASAIKQLRSTAGANQIVELVGYVRTGYGKQPIAKVKADVSRYANWPSEVKMDGIFFDEVVTESKWLKRYTEFTDLVKATKWKSSTSSSSNKAVKKRDQRSAITILNPGTWPDSSKFFNIADHIVVYEDKLSNFNYSEYKQKTARPDAGTPFQRSYIFYNVNPNNATTEDGKKLSLSGLVKHTVNGLNSTGGLFITSLDIGSTDVYASFSSIWQDFVKTVASLSR